MEKILIMAEHTKTGIMATTEFLQKHAGDLQRHPLITILPWGTRENPISCASSLYDLYHTADKLGLEKLLIEELPDNGLCYAIMNRVRRSAEN